MKKGNSNSQPERLQKTGETYQVRWNIQRNDRTLDDQTIESWDYNYADCKGSSRADIIEGIIRSVYTQSEVEAILSNYLEGNNSSDYVSFQRLRKLAKAVADNLPTDNINNVEVNDRVGDVEQAAADLIEVLNQKNIIP